EAKVKSPYCILVIPLLKDRTQYPEVSFIIMADCSEETQIQRVMARDSISRSDAKKIIEAQLPRTDRLKLADAVIDTDSEKTVKEHIKKLHSQFLHRSSNSTS
ncbi:MAG: dephospho-CoA kinase, partial [Gammaproteobacteria bacterium]|nr:dephospho-CoA kinase [Gammaproteobacteria bacterium]